MLRTEPSTFGRGHYEEHFEFGPMVQEMSFKVNFSSGGPYGQ